VLSMKKAVQNEHAIVTDELLRRMPSPGYVLDGTQVDGRALFWSSSHRGLAVLSCSPEGFGLVRITSPSLGILEQRLCILEMLGLLGYLGQ
jgi:hypothetical protein